MGLPPLVDTHCHLNLGELGGVADAAWARAQLAGVVQAVVPATDVASARAVVELVAPRPALFAAVGIHPNESADEVERAGGLDAAIAAIADQVARARDRKVVAIGETGLDCYRERASLDVQRASLVRHAELALAHDLPLILHVRQAFAPTAETLAPFAAKGLRAVMHCFDGGPAELHPFIDWGFFVSFSGILTYAKRDDLRDAARAAPRELLLVETDAPFLAPVPKRGRANEPAFVAHTAARLAETVGAPFAEIAALTTANARRLFHLPEPKA